MHIASRGIQQIAQQAFWDVLAEGLEARPPQWERLLALLEEARASLLELIPENADEGKQLRASALEKLDMVRSCNMERSLLLRGIEASEDRHVPHWGRRASLLDRIPDKAYEGKQLRLHPHRAQHGGQAGPESKRNQTEEQGCHAIANGGLKTRCHSGWSVLTLGSLGSILPPV